jgi:transcription elongation factor
MEAIVQEIDVEELTSIFNIPEDMRNNRVEVTIRPIRNEKQGTTEEKIERFRKKYNRETFVEQLKKGVSQGFSFDFDVQKVIDGTETEEEMQARYRKEKQTWGNIMLERKQRGEA